MITKKKLSVQWTVPFVVLLGSLVLIGVSGCDDARSASSADMHDHDDHDHDHDDHGGPGVSITENVRRNLGVTFAQAEYRTLQSSITVAGTFESTSDARREYRAMVGGRVTLMVDLFQEVTPGTTICRIDSPAWQNMRHEAVEAKGEIELAEAAMKVAQATKTELEQEAILLQNRIDSLSDVKVRRVDLENQVARLRNQLPRRVAELQAKQVELEEAHEHYLSRLNVLASITGYSVETLLKPGDDARVRWEQMKHLEIQAVSPGVVSSIAATNGGWLEAGTLITTSVDPGNLRFHADVPQVHLPKLRSGMPVRIAMQLNARSTNADAVGGQLRLGYVGHQENRSFPVYATPERVTEWTRPGVTAVMDIFTSGSDRDYLMIPVDAVVQDDLKAVFFRRDPNNRDQAIPVEADLGTSDGRWVVVKSGLREGDQVVVNGAYALLQAGATKQSPDGYHYHADGSLHKDH